MSKIAVKLDYHKIVKEFYKGYLIMASVKIYHDSRYKCKCGEKLNSFQIMPGHNPGDTYKIPSCEKCNSISNNLYIDARVIDLNGRPKRTKIRYAQDGRRIKTVWDCIYTLRQIEQELEDKKFDLRNYAPKEEQEKFIFKNLMDKYLARQEKRFEGKSLERKISKSTLKLCKKYAKRLIDFFGEFDTRAITKVDLEQFKNNFPSTKGELNLTLDEFKTIFKYAKSIGLVDLIPEIGKTEKSKIRKSTLTEEEAKTIINAVDDEMYQRIYRFLYLYPVRPCDVRALKWENVDLIKGEVTFDTHFSDGIIEEGRKSQLPGETHSSVTLPISTELRFILNEQKIMYKNCFPEDHVFRGKIAAHVGESTFNINWRKAAKKSGFHKTSAKKYDVYELKHLAITRLFDLTNSVLVCSKASGVSEQTILQRYIKNQKELKQDYFSGKPELRITGS